MRQQLAVARAFPGYALSKLPLIGELIGATFPALAPPVLIVSLPRSGSSWIGGILGATESSLYLREPIIKAYRRWIGQPHHPSCFEWGICGAPEAYDRFASLALKGIPRFEQSIVPHLEQWAILGRTQKRVVVKELNPLVLKRLWQRFRPKIVYLIRHPVPVARSYHTLGWTGPYSAHFRPETLAALSSKAKHTLCEQASFWEQCGAYQAVVQNLAMEFLATIDHIVLRYEDVCSEPIKEFSRVFDFCKLPFSERIQEKIEYSSRGTTNYKPGTYDTVRNSRDIRERWKRDMESNDIQRVRSGYFACRPAFYREESDW
jgi:Sulfotransferase domain